MNFKINTKITNLELDDPTLNDFMIGMETYCITYDEDNNQTIKEIKIVDTIYKDSVNLDIYHFDFPLEQNSKDFIYPILKPIENLKNEVLPSNIFSFSERRHIIRNEVNQNGFYDDKQNLIKWGIKQLIWLRNHKYCTANFKFANQIKNVNIIINEKSKRTKRVY